MTNDTNNKKEKEITKLYQADTNLEVRGEVKSDYSGDAMLVSSDYSDSQIFKNKEDAKQRIEDITESPQDYWDYETDLREQIYVDSEIDVDDNGSEVIELSILDTLLSEGSSYFKKNFPDYEIVGDLKLVLKEDKKEVSESTNNSINQNQPTA